MFWNKICGFIAIFFICPLFSGAQTASYIKFAGSKSSKTHFSRDTVTLTNKADFQQLSRPFEVIPQNYYIHHFGIMCKKELALEKATKIPFKFRLGSLQQCNYLEGKK